MGFDKNPKSRINLFVYPLKMDDSAILSTVSLLVALGGTLLGQTKKQKWGIFLPWHAAAGGAIESAPAANPSAGKN